MKPKFRHHRLHHFEKNEELNLADSARRNESERFTELRPCFRGKRHHEIIHSHPKHDTMDYRSDPFLSSRLKRIDMEDARLSVQEAIQEARGNCMELYEVCGGIMEKIQIEPYVDFMSFDTSVGSELVTYEQSGKVQGSRLSDLSNGVTENMSSYDAPISEWDVNLLPTPSFIMVPTIPASASCLMQHQLDSSLSDQCILSLRKLQIAADTMNMTKIQYMQHRDCSIFFLPLLFFIIVAAFLSKLMKRRARRERVDKILSAIHSNPDIRAIIEADCGEIVPPPRLRDSSFSCIKVFLKLVGALLAAFFVISTVIFLVGIFMDILRTEINSDDDRSSDLPLLYSLDIATMLLWWSVFILTFVLVRVFIRIRERARQQSNSSSSRPSAPPLSSLSNTDRVTNMFRTHFGPCRYSPMTGTRSQNVENEELTVPLYQPPNSQPNNPSA